MAKKAEVIITCDAQTVKKVLEGINNEIAKTAKRREELEKKQNANIRLTKQEEKELQGLIKYENALNERVPKITGEMKKYGEVMKDLAGSKTKDLKKALREVKQQLENMGGNDARRKQLVNDMKKIQAQIDANTGSLKKNTSAWGALGTTMKNLFAYAGIFAGFNMLKSKLSEIYELNKKFSDSMANVRKVSGLAMDDIKQLANNLSKVDSRTSLEGLMGLSYTGAKLGFGNYGIEGLEAFAKSAVKVQNALSEDMGEDSMTALSKLVEVMGLIPKMGVERAMDAAGSAIFKLASTSTATGTNIIEFTKRLMGLANVSHVTTSELLALGSASDSMGLMAEVSATAFNKVFTSIQSNTRGIEEALKMTKGELVDLVNQGRTMDAIVTVFEKMHGMNMDQLKAQGVFKALGSDGARLNNVMVTMSNRIDMLRDHLATSNQAFEEGTAVAQEYAIQMDTAAAYSERAANIWQKAFVNPEGVDTVKEFTKAWYDVSVAMTSNKAAMAEVKFLLGGILELIKAIMYFLPALLSGLAVLAGGRLFAWAKAAFEINTLKTAFQGLSLSVGALKTAWTGLSTVAKANWIGAIATAVFMAIEAFGMFNKKVKEASGYMEGFKRDLSDLNTEYGKADAELRRYRKAIDEANVGTKQRAAAIAQFNSKFKPYLNNLLTEKSTADEVAKAYDRITQAMRTKLALQLKEKDINDQVAPREQWAAQRREEYDRLARAAGKGQYGATWLTGYSQDNAGKSISDAVSDIGKQYYDLPQKIIEEVAKQAAAGYRTFNNTGNIINSRYLKKANALLAAGSYIRQDRAATNAMNSVNRKWAPEQKRMDDMLAAQNQPDVITPIDGDRPTKEELKELRKQQQEAKQAARKELQDLTRESQAIMDKVEEFYRLQETTVEAAVADGQKTRAEADAYLRDLKISKNRTLAEVRGVLSGQTKLTDDEWADYVRKNLLPIMADQGEWSADLAKDIERTSINTIAQLLRNFNGKWNGTDITSTALLDKIAKGRAGNLREIQRERAKVIEEVDRILLQYNYIEQANKAFHDDLVGLGIMSETYEQYVKRLQSLKATADATTAPDGSVAMQGTIPEVAVTSTRRLRTPEEQMRQQFIANGTKPYLVNPTSQKEMELWLKNFITNYEFDPKMNDWKTMKEDWARAFPQIDEWLANIDEHMPDIQRFYFDLIKYEDTYYDALKKSADRQRKLFDERWERSGQGEAFTDALNALDLRQRRREMTGADQGTNFAQQAGFTTLGEDPELAASMLRMEQMRQELELMRQISQDKALIREREQALAEAQMAMEEQIMAKINERIQKLQEWTEPINSFAETIGTAAGEAIRNSQSMSEQVQDALKNMVKAYGETTIKIVSELMMQKLKERMIRRAMSKDIKTSQQEQTDIEKEGGESRLEARNIVETGIFSITQQMGQQILQTKKAQDQQEMVEEGAKAQGGVMAGIAEGAAKIIGSLGWWGIPLIAVITALLNGLLNMALSALFGGGGSDNGASTQTKKSAKLVSGMLTYDEGNVREVIGTDGRLYRAQDQPQLPDGVSVVTQPIATTVNGQQALVGEQGPEIVIGRRTSRAIMMNEPGLLHHLMQLDQHRYGLQAMRAYDSGNVSQMADGGSQMADGSPAGNGALDQLTAVVAQLSQTVTALQQKGVPAYINKYGTGGLIEEVKSGLKFDQRYNG